MSTKQPVHGATISPATRVSAAVAGEIAREGLSNSHERARPDIAVAAPASGVSGASGNTKGQRPHRLGSLERRGATRVPLQRQVAFRFRTTAPLSVGKTVDISTNGLYLETPRSVHPGTCIAGFIRTEAGGHEQQLEFLGQVVWSARQARVHDKGTGFAVRFLHLSDNDHERLRRIVTSHRSSLS